MSAPELRGAGERLRRQIGFIVEIEKLKRVERQTWHLEGIRPENDAEHSWHLAMMLFLLQEHAAGAPVDLLRVLKMALIHDIVEVDAGDTYCYDDAGNATRDIRERAAAERLFGMLPDDQRGEVFGLWREFEERKTPEARFAAALDRLQPLLMNYCADGRSWLEHGISKQRSIAKNAHIAEGAPALWDLAQSLIEDATARGLLRDDEAR